MYDIRGETPVRAIVAILVLLHSCYLQVAFAGDGTCTRISEVCVDGPGAKIVQGHPVTRDCWQIQAQFDCLSARAVNDCAEYKADPKCSQIGSKCTMFAPTGSCSLFEQTFSCKVKDGTTSMVTDCGTQSYCSGGACFDTGHPPDGDFGYTVAMMEAKREIGAYFDQTRLEIFRGSISHCGKRLGLSNCCKPNSGGASSSTNRALVGGALNVAKEVADVGSQYVYDSFFNGVGQTYMNNLQSVAGFDGVFNPSFSYFGVTVGFGAAPAGSFVIAQTQSLYLAFNPVTFVIAVIIYVVTEYLACDEKEQVTQMKSGAGLCHYVGEYCSSSFLGACLEKDEGMCCFNSKLARIINEQGRAQISKGWGPPDSPDCSGFKIPELQSLNWAAMDLSEFYAEIAPKLPDNAALQNKLNNSVCRAAGTC